MEFTILHAIQKLHQPLLDSIMVGITSLGDKGMIWILLGLFMLCTKKYRKCGIVVLISLFAAVTIGNGWLKHLVQRPRPCWIDQSVALLIPNPRDYSFPSGHTYSSFAAAISILIYHKKEGIAACILASLIAFSRLYLFVHFPTDVVGGLLLGIGTAVIISKIVNRYVKI